HRPSRFRSHGEAARGGGAAARSQDGGCLDVIRLAYPQPFVVNRTASRTPMHLLPEGEKLAEMAIRIGFTLLIAFLLQRLLFIAAGRMEKLIVRHGHGTRHAIQRARTLGHITRNLITLVIGVSALVHVLEIMGWDVK